ncbi:TetR/AcrR family transcriptional regulator [Gordonia sp. zg691]|uniref:TetR/AcrR family transcriptional regulator n=1 Tax=Gordonia jinghuaiqii TaxID=2758710 RepID=UPI0016622EE4|nr:TetR/AcrR family transcriptional regulator [Gordonia jinghuaiqii]MBD0862347.1 TetR/AcrR family transcriptional regulator [Gordonia jinghuaiqii]
MSEGHDTGTAGTPPESVRDRLVTATIGLLADGGPSEIKVRRIADEAGVSTVAVYHHFGGVRELLEVVVGSGYRALQAALENAAHADPDPGAQLFAMALACREQAQGNPHLYDMMFGLSTRGTYRHVADAPEGGPAARFLEAYAVFADACHRLVRSGRIAVTEGQQVAAELWSTVHGFVTLEVAGHFAQFADPVADVLTPMAINHLVGMGDERSRAERSAATAVAWWDLEHAQGRLRNLR